MYCRCFKTEIRSTPRAPARRLNPATTVDAFASWPLTRRLQVVGRAENLFNALVMAGINGDGSVERATPRTLWIGLRLN